MFVKKLHHLFIPHYQRIVAEHEKLSFISSKGKKEELLWEDDVDQEEAKRRILMLEELAKTPKDEREEERHRVFIEGNDTIN
jgi:hypothetical protein